MFPVDSIKVRLLFSLFRPLGAVAFPVGMLIPIRLFSWDSVRDTDANASIRHLASGGVHRARQRLYANIVDRGRARLMAWRLFGDHGRRPSARRTLWDVRGHEGANGRESRGKREPVVIGA